MKSVECQGRHQLSFPVFSNEHKLRPIVHLLHLTDPIILIILIIIIIIIIIIFCPHHKIVTSEVAMVTYHIG